MFQNVKVDIIYYKVQTDFEMEFNLSGCCRMRLLTGKAPDRKNLVNQLVRAVSRSRIILLTGALFDKTGIIETCAKAIGRKLIPVDNQRFGIQCEDSIEVISDSIPLVSTDGIFGGCIVEQGPQTLILLTDNRNVRKNVMKNLIHPYIKDVCAAEMDDKELNNQNSAAKIVSEVVTSSTVNTPIMSEFESVIPEFEYKSKSFELEDEAQTGLNEETSIGVIHARLETEEAQRISSETEIELSDDATVEGNSMRKKTPITKGAVIDLREDIYLEEDEEIFEKDKRIVNKVSDSEALGMQNLIFDEEYELPKIPYIPEEFKDFYIDEDEYDLKIKNVLNRGINVTIMIVAVLLLGLAAAICYFIFFSPTKQDIGVAQYIKEVFDTLFV